MDKNSIIGLTLIFIVFALFFWINKPSEEQLAQQKRYNDSIALVQRKADSVKLAQSILNSNNVAESQANAISSVNDMYGAFSNAAIGQESFINVVTPKLNLTFSTLGGKLSSVILPEFNTYDSMLVTLVNEKSSHFGLNFFSNNRLIDTEKMYFVPSVNANETIYLEGEEDYTLSMRLYPNDNGTSNERYIEFLYRISGDDYMLDVDCNIVGMQDLIYSQNSYIDLVWSMDLLQQEKLKENKLNGSNIFYQYDGDDADNLVANRDGEEDLSVKTKWISYKQQFFASTLVARDESSFVSGTISARTDNAKANLNDKYIKTMSSQLSIPYYGESNESFDMSMYFGPTKFVELNKYDLGLEDQINIGKFFLVRWINRVIMFVFNFFGGFISNYGLIIFLLTLLLKVILLPISYKSYLSTAKLRALKPEMDDLNAKYPNPDDAMKKQQEVMALYQKFGVSPMSGCLPMLLQFPILIAMFRFFPVAFELRQKPFLWADDLSAYDSILDLPFNIPFYGDHVSLFTLLMTISTIVYTKINNKTMGQESQPGMKFMTYFMPIMFLGIFNSYSAGLSYYYLLSNLLSFAQTYIIGKIKPTEKLRSELLWQAAQKTKNGGKASGKSRWQKKLEELEKMQREQLRQQNNSRR